MAASPAVDAEMVKLHLRLRPGERCCALEGGAVAMLVDQVEQCLACRGDHRPECDARSGAGRDPHAPAQGEDRVENRADRVGKRPAVDHRDRRADAVATAEEAGPVGFNLRLAHRLAVDYRQMRRPRSPVRSASRRRRVATIAPSSARYSVCDEQLRKGRMGDVVRLRRQHQFGIGGDLDLAHAAARIRDRDAADFGIVFGRDHHLHRRRQRSVVTDEFGAILVEDDVVPVGLDAGWLEAG